MGQLRGFNVGVSGAMLRHSLKARVPDNNVMIYTFLNKI